MKIFGLLRIRNESEIIKNTLDHMSFFCDGVFIYDDCSTDNTVDICKSHPLVKEIYESTIWSTDRYTEEYRNRQILLDMARDSILVSSDDIFVYQDADEYLEFDLIKLKQLFKTYDAVKMNLWDFYITPFDINKNYLAREYIGREYRNIMFFFKNNPNLKYYLPDQREVTLPYYYKVITYGNVKHFGKAISIKQWDETCKYYVDNFPKYAEKWKGRIGKAVKRDMLSDFETELIKWNNKSLENGIKI